MKSKNQKIKREVLKKIAPNPEEKEKLKKIIKELIGIVKKEIKKRQLDISIELVGSISKDTYLKNNLDIDLFLKFPTTINKEEISENTLSIGESILKNTDKCYAEHPYIRGLYKNYEIEIVPCYKIEKASQILSAVDRTPLHSRYVKENLKRYQKKEVRLLKQFLRGIGCYGAEADVEGFSGYLCEILIIKYGSFEKLLRNVQYWNQGKKIAINNENNKDFNTPLTFIDPIDRNRNVSSALSIEKFELFCKACKDYIENPKITFFFPNDIKPWSINRIRKNIQNHNHKYLGLILVKPNILRENLYPQIRKAIRSIKEACKKYDFIIFEIIYWVDDIDNLILFIIKTNNIPLSKTYIHVGPPTKLKKNARTFIQKWKNDSKIVKKPYEKNGRLYVEIKREYRLINDFLKSNVEKLSMGKHLDIIRNKFEVVEVEYLLKNKYRLFWTKYLDNKMSWNR